MKTISKAAVAALFITAFVAAPAFAQTNPGQTNSSSMSSNTNGSSMSGGSAMSGDQMGTKPTPKKHKKPATGAMSPASSSANSMSGSNSMSNSGH